MTDTASPITGPVPSPMFDTGPQDNLAPTTEPHPAPIFDTGPHPGPLQPLGAQEPAPEAAPEMPVPQAFSESENVDTDAFLRSVTGHLPPVVIAAQPVAVPGSYQFVKRWQFGLILAGVALVTLDGKWQYIDRFGAVVWRE